MNKRQRKKYWRREWRKWGMGRPHVMKYLLKKYYGSFHNKEKFEPSYPLLALIPKTMVTSGEEIRYKIEIGD